MQPDIWIAGSGAGQAQCNLLQETFLGFRYLILVEKWGQDYLHSEKRTSDSCQQELLSHPNGTIVRTTTPSGELSHLRQLTRLSG